MTPTAAKNGAMTRNPWAYAAAAGLFVGGALAGLIVGLKTDPSPDRWTGTQHSQYAELVDEKILTLGKQVSELATIVNLHVISDMHHGARVQFTKIQSEQAHILESLERIESRLEKIEEK